MYKNTAHMSDEMGRLSLGSLGAVNPQSYSPGTAKRMGPVVPPRPKKQPGRNEYRLENCDAGAGLYSNVPAPVPGYFAVNAPAPGIVGVATARLNKGYSGSKEYPEPPGANSAYGNQPDPPQPQYRMSPYSNYTPPSPQPALSYTPTSRMAVQINAQPLYSNTGSQPLYSNSSRPTIAAAGYQNQSQQPGQMRQTQLHSSSPVYANTSSNGAMYVDYSKGRLGSSAASYTSYGRDDEFPLPPLAEDDRLAASPPSPVSSSYSELRRATPSGYDASMMTRRGYETYAPPSQASSTYESIYEPINPRPSSEMSNKTGGYSVYGPYTSPRSTGLVPAPSNQPLLNPDRVGKEAEVDALTNLLVQSMDGSSDPDFFGVCTRCGEQVVGEGAGCTAMEQVYHIKCLVCIVCHLQLEQRKPFYALDSKPYCEECYMNTLEKCSVCAQPILDRILRATGKPYHPQCFTCVECQKSLEGIPFTVDASNQIHCIDDFHKKFAPRCSVCRDPIMPEPGKDETVRVVALDRSFHVECYKCEDCYMVLSSEAEGRGCYPLDGHVLCKNCNAMRVLKLTSRVTKDH